MRQTAEPTYTPPASSAEDDRAMLNWLSMRVADDARHCHPDHGYERVLVEHRLRVARRLKLTMQPGVYLPRLEQAQQQVDVLRRQRMPAPLSRCCVSVPWALSVGPLPTGQPAARKAG